jgi:cytochrome c-type biogenesis protein CcmH
VYHNPLVNWLWFGRFHLHPGHDGGRLAGQLYCPVCENIPLDVCPTQACAQWRDLVREKLAAGWNEQQIKDYFVDQYGDRVLGIPPPRGLNWLFYVIPPLAILAGIFIVVKALRAMRQQRETHPAPTNSPVLDHEDEYIRKLEERLRKTD